MEGAEIVDLIGYNGWLHVYFLTKTQDPAGFGFWAAKVKMTAGAWVWELIVGNAPGARYPAGVGNPDNGVAVPFRFKNYVYVGTFDVGTGLQVLNPPFAPPAPILNPLGFDLYSTHGWELRVESSARSWVASFAGLSPPE